jgi:hypothetical protein
MAGPASTSSSSAGERERRSVSRSARQHFGEGPFFGDGNRDSRLRMRAQIEIGASRRDNFREFFFFLFVVCLFLSCWPRPKDPYKYVSADLYLRCSGDACSLMAMATRSPSPRRTAVKCSLSFRMRRDEEIMDAEPVSHLPFPSRSPFVQP